MDWQTLYQRLSSESFEMRQLDDQQFMELKAVLPKGRTLDLARIQRDRAGDERERKAFEWMKALLRFNEFARQAQSAVQSPAPSTTPGSFARPQNREEAAHLGYVSLSDVLCVLRRDFTNYASLNRYLDRHPGIRRYKPNGSRKMVHAGDLIRQLADEADRTFEGRDRDDEVQEIAKQIKESRKVGRK